ncbi:MAG: hypothetical protein MZV63_55355 [Marinilabiliales bacterium]|nr:hypothetical protein [Marinilabiliales bacterium]
MQADERIAIYFKALSYQGGRRSSEAWSMKELHTRLPDGVNARATTVRFRKE